MICDQMRVTPHHLRTFSAPQLVQCKQRRALLHMPRGPGMGGEFTVKRRSGSETNPDNTAIRWSWRAHNERNGRYRAHGTLQAYAQGPSCSRETSDPGTHAGAYGSGVQRGVARPEHTQPCASSRSSTRRMANRRWNRNKGSMSTPKACEICCAMRALPDLRLPRFSSMIEAMSSAGGPLGPDLRRR